MSEVNLLHNFPQWEKMKKDLEDDLYNVNIWNELITHHEKLVNDHQELLKTRKELKKLIFSDFDRLLTKFPYYLSYWQRYIALVKSLEGLKSSVTLLERSLVSFSYSLDLWVDYLTVITSNSLKTEKELTEIFQQGAEKVGYHFLGHQFWDIYLKWAKSVYGTNSNDYMNILLKVIKIPLHQYAKYNEEFNKNCQKFTLLDLVNKDDLILFIKNKKLLLNPNDSDIDEYIESYSEELRNSYFSEILIEIESRAQTKWKYESLLKHEFDLNMITLDELNEWTQYLIYEEDYHKNTNNDLTELISLYERSLIPTCLSDKIWSRYARYLIQNDGNKDQIIQIFNRACDHFVPLDLHYIRYMYIKFIEIKVGNFENCNQMFLSLIKRTPTEAEPVSKYLEFLFSQEKDEKSKMDLTGDIINCVILFEKNNTKPAIKGTYEIYNKNILDLSKSITFWNVGQLIVNVCKYFWLEQKNIQRARDTLMRFISFNAIKSSKEYWFFFFKFEVCQRNKKNLFHIIQQVKLKSKLSISNVNFLIKEYNSFVMKNFTITELKQYERELTKNILEIDYESSMHMKHFLKARLADGNDEETINKRIYRENGHPAAICEGRPIITNPLLLSSYTFIDDEIPPLPRFRNVEKANLNVKYIHESI